MHSADSGFLWAPSRRQKTVAKLLQSASEFGLLVRLPSGKLLTIFGRCLNWIQWLWRTTGKCLLAADEARSVVTPEASHFASKTRVTTLDGASANDRCERQIQRDRAAAGWKRLSVTCFIHKAAIIHTHVFSCVEEVVSGQVNLALCVNQGVGISALGRHLRSYVAGHLRILRGSCPKDAIPYKRQLLRLCLGRGTRLLEKKAVLWALPNGDWRVCGEIQIYIPEGAPADVAKITDTIAQALELVLLGCRFVVFPRSRWTQRHCSRSDVVVRGVAQLVVRDLPALAT